MFAPLKISIREIEKLYSKVGNFSTPQISSEQEAFYNNILSKVKKNGVIDGSNLSKLNFPFDEPKYDVFISYSHNDKDYALYLCAYLRKQGLKCFLDSTIWHSADALLEEIDKQFCSTDDGCYFDYQKRNFSTSHVHAMLSMAMLEGIKRSECCIFIESNNSVTLEDGIKQKTLSPWIYEEVSFAKSCQITIPKRYSERYLKEGMKMFCEGGKVEIRDSKSLDLKIAYDINLNDFQSIGWQDIFDKPGTKMLNNIYNKYGIIKDIRSILID